jgi:4-oxalomesaconate hydratase
LDKKRILVVGAHTADWVWRSAGTIAKYIKDGVEVFVVCLSFGARGESAELWKSPGQTIERVKKQRSEEASAAARVLDVTSIEIWDFDDCILEISPRILDRLNLKIREVNPGLIITHDTGDNTNTDHAFASEIVFRASIMAKQSGIESDGLAPARMVPIYGFEPSQPECSGFVPGIYIDITDTWEQKIKAMECIVAQKKTPEVHKRINTHRGWQAARLPGGRGVQYAEAYSVRYPIVAKEFPIKL